MTQKTDKSSGFTLIELLVVIAIIGLLSSIVLASLSGARERAQITRMVSDFKQLENGLILWMDANGKVAWPGEGSLSFTQVKNDGYLNSVPEPPLGDVYDYDNDGDTFTCGDIAYRGVNIIVRNLPTGISEEVNKIMEDDADGNENQDLSCGKVRGNNTQIFYSLSNDGNL